MTPAYQQQRTTVEASVRTWLKTHSRTKERQQQLFVYVKQADAESLRVFLRLAKVDLNGVDSAGCSLLAYAVGAPQKQLDGSSAPGQPSIECMRALQEAGALPNVALSVVRQGRHVQTTALIEAVKRGQSPEALAVLEAFLEMFPDALLEFAPGGRTALDVAMAQDLVGCAKALVAHGAQWKEKCYPFRINPFSQCYAWLSDLRAAQYQKDADGFVQVPLDSPSGTQKFAMSFRF